MDVGKGVPNFFKKSLHILSLIYFIVALEFLEISICL